jgi:hypothetical protein
LIFNVFYDAVINSNLMKTLVLFFSVLLIPVYLYSQGGVQKQNYSQSSNRVSQSQTYQGSVQSTNSYQPRQTYQPTPQYNQHQSEPYQVEKQNNSQLQSGYTQDAKYQNSYKYNKVEESNLNRSDRSLQTVLLRDVAKRNTQKTVRTATQRGKNLVKVGNSTEIAPHDASDHGKDYSVSSTTSEVVLVKYPVKNSYVPQSPEVVYKLTPTLRLRCVLGRFNGLCDLNGFGVHIATFINFNYCVGVANWIRKKYHAISFIFEDQSGIPHYHLVFGKWSYYKEAEVFEGKVRREAPHAFVIRWRSDLSVLYPNGNIMKAY